MLLSLLLKYYLTKNDTHVKNFNMSEQYSKYDLNELKKILDISKNRIFDLFTSYKGFIDSYQNLQKKYDLESESSFNIFSSISDTYKKENLHSDIIRLILDPSTEKIGNEKNIVLFVKLLNKIKPELKIVLNKNVVVEREKGRIDLLIYDSKHNSIIVENKINYAKDQYNQIGRYYERALKRGLNVMAIVYITLLPDDKKLDIDYSIKDNKQRESIEHLIIPLHILNKKRGISFADGFINECINCSENDIAKVYYSEYKELLKSLGGTFMTMDLDRATLLEIYSNKEKLDAFNMLGSLWSRSGEIFNGIIRELLKENDFHEHPDDPKNTLFFKLDDNVSLGYHVGEWSFGFTKTPKGKDFSTTQQNDLKIILENKRLKDIFSKTDNDPDNPNENWVWRMLDIDKVGDCKCIINNFNILKELYLNDLKAEKRT